MRRLTTLDQVERMRRQWPTFRVLCRTRCDVVWEGALQPLCRIFLVRLMYQLKPGPRSAETGLVRVTVINPLLRRRDEAPNEPIPHHYPNRLDPELPYLCLYDPATREWHPGRSIALTIVPWTTDWLACYEGWLATGKWTGGGRHPTVE